MLCLVRLSAVRKQCGPILIRLSWHDAGVYNGVDPWLHVWVLCLQMSKDWCLVNSRKSLDGVPTSQLQDPVRDQARVEVLGKKRCVLVMSYTSFHPHDVSLPMESRD